MFDASDGCRIGTAGSAKRLQHAKLPGHDEVVSVEEEEDEDDEDDEEEVEEEDDGDEDFYYQR